MSLNLDDRQRAMLAEMGVRVWWPAEPLPPEAVEVAPDVVLAQSPRIDIVQADPVAPDALESHAALVVPPPHTSAPASLPASVTAPAASVRGPEQILPLAQGIAEQDWPALHASVLQCQACAMCLGRRTPVLATVPNDLRADWLVVGEPPDDAQERAGHAFVDDAGRLLDNMLAAVGVRRWDKDQSADPARRAYLSLVLKCRPALPTAPDAQALAACAHYLRREIALAQPKVIVAMGRLAMQVLLSEAHPQGLQLPLGKLRGQVWRYQGVPVVVSYPPAYLLRQGQDKGRAWEDLCLARAVAQGMRTS